jgi:hypothetical protein
MRDALSGVLALAPAPRGFTVADFATKVHAITGTSDTEYSIRQAAYDLRKLRGKQLVDKPEHAPLPSSGAGRAHHRCTAHPARPSHRPDPRRGAQPPHGTQTRALDARRP